MEEEIKKLIELMKNKKVEIKELDDKRQKSLDERQKVEEELKQIFDKKSVFYKECEQKLEMANSNFKYNLNKWMNARKEAEKEVDILKVSIIEKIEKDKKGIEENRDIDKSWQQVKEMMNEMNLKKEALKYYESTLLDLNGEGTEENKKIVEDKKDEISNMMSNIKEKARIINLAQSGKSPLEVHNELSSKIEDIKKLNLNNFENSILYIKVKDEGLQQKEPQQTQKGQTQMQQKEPQQTQKGQTQMQPKKTQQKKPYQTVRTTDIISPKKIEFNAKENSYKYAYSKNGREIEEVIKRKEDIDISDIKKEFLEKNKGISEERLNEILEKTDIPLLKAIKSMEQKANIPLVNDFLKGLDNPNKYKEKFEDLKFIFNMKGVYRNKDNVIEESRKLMDMANSYKKLGFNTVVKKGIFTRIIEQIDKHTPIIEKYKSMQKMLNAGTDERYEIKRAKEVKRILEEKQSLIDKYSVKKARRFVKNKAKTLKDTVVKGFEKGVSNCKNRKERNKQTSSIAKYATYNNKIDKTYSDEEMSR